MIDIVCRAEAAAKRTTATPETEDEKMARRIHESQDEELKKLGGKVMLGGQPKSVPRGKKRG